MLMSLPVSNNVVVVISSNFTTELFGITPMAVTFAFVSEKLTCSYWYILTLHVPKSIALEAFSTFSFVRTISLFMSTLAAVVTTLIFLSLLWLFWFTSLFSFYFVLYFISCMITPCLKRIISTRMSFLQHIFV